MLGSKISFQNLSINASKYALIDVLILGIFNLHLKLLKMTQHSTLYYIIHLEKIMSKVLCLISYVLVKGKNGWNLIFFYLNYINYII